MGSHGLGLFGIVALAVAASESAPEEWREGAPATRRERAKAPDPRQVNTTREQERRRRQMARRAANPPRCKHPDHDAYPQYGLGPHVCFYQRGPGFVPGQSLSKPRAEFPPNFTPDPGEWAQDDSKPVVGVWTCPGCLGAKR